MKIALFCHADGDPLDSGIQQELSRQYTLLEDYAHRQDYSIEYAAFHTGSLCLDPPDQVLLALLQYAQAKEFDVILVESKARFPLSQPDRLPPIELYFLQEGQRLEFGTSTAPIFQQFPPRPDSIAAYWRQDSAPTFGFSLQ